MGSSSEHWRTVCVCTICGQTPEVAPLFKCTKSGHTYCNPCYDQLRAKSRDGQCICSLCGGREFFVDPRGPDFLRKLRVKPGIGRPYRYKISKTDSILSCTQLDVIEKPVLSQENVTVEELFRLPKEDLKELFADETRQRLREATMMIMAPKSAKSIASCGTKEEGNVEKKPTLKDITKGSSSSVYLTRANQRALVSQRHNQCSPFSRKPLKCPHDPCQKTVAVSLFLTHFKHEHPHIRRYNVDRGKQLVIPIDASLVEHGVTFCIALVTVYDMSSIKPSPKASPSVTNVCNKMNSKVPFNTFWLMVSGSPEETASSAYAIYWLFTCNNNSYTCTMEMASANDTTSCSTFCGVNGNNESQDIDEVAHRMNCLYLTKGTMSALLEDGADIKLGITVH